VWYTRPSRGLFHSWFHYYGNPHKEYLTAIVTHFGHWVQVPRRQATGPAPKPRWMPLPELLYAQVVKTVRRRRLVDV
jgi:hypothetical protein